MFDASALDAPRRPRDAVIALHCSGATPKQWIPLATALGPHYALSAPMYCGSDEVGPWTGEHAFGLADEAQHINALIDTLPGKVHLVGHSYGGAVALHIACARPERIASLSLYEPAAFHLLTMADEHAKAALHEIKVTRKTVATLIARGDYRAAAMLFLDYWGGYGAWNALRPSQQQALTRWIPKSLLDFQSAISETMPLHAYTQLEMPVLLLKGEHALRPTRHIADILAEQLPSVTVQMIAGAGHMGPLTHAEAVATAIARHIADTRSEIGVPLSLAPAA